MKYLGIIFLLFAGAISVAAQQPWLTDAERTRFEELRRSGLDALYNIDYDKAQQDFKEIIRLYPNHPGGYQLLAARVWIKTLYESRRLQVSLYSNESFYTNGDDKVDPKIVTEFRNLTREAKRLAEAKLKQEPKNIEALDFLANTQGLKASFEEAVERRHIAALRDGTRTSKVVGSSVYNDARDDIGKVDDIIIPRGGGAPVAIISVGGFLGIGSRYVAVPLS